ncbi:transient receptor potential channel pyrexia [Penaeus vannamei]|uniref:transient receptor potential channel pyrexia n=1 Tax=Penaeus vannamei TaxID=6689 RepID=UPI00387F60B6
MSFGRHGRSVSPPHHVSGVCGLGLAAQSARKVSYSCYDLHEVSGNPLADVAARERPLSTRSRPRDRPAGWGVPPKPVQPQRRHVYVTRSAPRPSYGNYDAHSSSPAPSSTHIHCAMNGSAGGLPSQSWTSSRHFRPPPIRPRVYSDCPRGTTASRSLRIKKWLQSRQTSMGSQDPSFASVDEGDEEGRLRSHFLDDITEVSENVFNRKEKRTFRVSAMKTRRRRQWRTTADREISPASETSHVDSEASVTFDKTLLEVTEGWNSQAVREHRINALRSFLTTRNQPLAVLNLLEAGKISEAIAMARECKVRVQLDVCLLWACQQGAVDIVRSLVAAGASVEAQDSDGCGTLHLAAESGSEEVIQALVEAGAKAGSYRDWDLHEKLTPLMMAARSGCVGGIKILLGAGADIDAGLDTTGETALHHAVRAGAPECVQLLISSGATVNPTTLYSESPLHVAVYEDLPNVVDILLSAGANVRASKGTSKMTALHIASNEGYYTIAHQLLKAGANPNQENQMGQTALHLAAKSQSYDTVQVLLSFSADPNARDRDLKTPLHYGIFKGSRSHECLRLLLEAGADTNAADLSGYTPLHIAAVHDSSYCVLLFLNHGADVTARTQGGVSALHLILRRTPTVLATIQENLDAAISFTDHDHQERDSQAQINFRVLVPGDTIGMESRMLSCFSREGQKLLLKHPVCEIFLLLKWLRVRNFFIFNLIFYSVLVALLSCYIMVVFPAASCYHLNATTQSKQAAEPQGPFEDEEDNLLRRDCGLHYEAFMVSLLYIIWFGFGILLLKEIFQMIDTPRTYFSSWDNVLIWPIIILTLTITISSYVRHDTRNWEHHLAAVVILLTWAELLSLIGRFPLFGVYIHMFTHVTKNFAKFLCAYACLLTAFSLSFGVLFPNQESFGKYGYRLIKTMVMMTGEIEYNDLFYGDEKLLYPETTHIIFFVFLIFVTIILMNLLVGLAVSDIQRLQKSAGLDLLVRQTDLISHFEAIMFSKWLKWILPKGILGLLHHRISLCPSLYGWTHVLTQKTLQDTGLPQETMDVVLRIARTRDHVSRRRNAFANFRTLSKTAQYSNDADGNVESSMDALRFGLDLLVWDADERRDDARQMKDDLAMVSSEVENMAQIMNAITMQKMCTSCQQGDERSSIYTSCETMDFSNGGNPTLRLKVPSSEASCH